MAVDPNNEQVDASAPESYVHLLEDYSHFARDYKKRFGEPPSSTRRQARIADIVKSAMKLSFRP